MAEVARWRLDERHGTTAKDSVGTNDGTSTNTIVSNGSGIIFNGTTDLINSGSDASIDDIFVGGGTISWKQRVDGLGENNLGRPISKATWWVEVVNNTSTMRFTQTFSVGIGRWTFPVSPSIEQAIAIVYNNDLGANDPVVYVNGISVTVTETSTPGSNLDTSDAGSDLVIGNDVTGVRTWDGVLSDIRMNSDELTAGEIANLADDTTRRSRRIPR
jgi:hypothetical protein